MGIYNPPAANEQAYVFVDGAYLRQIAEKMMGALFGTPADLNFASLATASGQRAKRVFYYDCLDDRKRHNESDSEYENRVHEQETLFDSIQSLSGFHVRLGSLAGTRTRKIRQKKVDVLLVVDALENAFRGNMSRCSIIAGDLDFLPLVESLVRFGTYVQVLYEPSSASRALYRAADLAQEITVQTLYCWMSHQFQQSHPIPQATQGEPVSAQPNVVPLKQGSVKGEKITLFSVPNGFALSVPKFSSLVVRFPDQQLLIKYFDLVYGRIEW